MLPDLLSLEYQGEYGNEAKNAPHTSEKEEDPLISYLLGKFDGVECESHAKLLPEEVEHLAYFATFRSVAVDCVGVARGRDDLKAEACYTHALLPTERLVSPCFESGICAGQLT